MKEPIFEIELNYIPPPKSNRYMSNNGRRFLPERIRTAIDDTIILLRHFKRTQKLKTIEDYVLVDVLFVLPNRRRVDLDNIMKTLGDCLEKAEIIKDDNLIAKKIIEKAFSKNKQARTVIRIYPYKIRLLH